MMKKFKRQWIPMYTVQDVDGEYWDIHEDQKIAKDSDVRLVKGFPYGHNPQNSECKSLKLVLTPEIAEYIKQYNHEQAIKILGVSKTTITRFRRRLGIAKPVTKKESQWLFEHKEALLYAPLSYLKDQYGLSSDQVQRQLKWLKRFFNIEQKRPRLIKSEYGFAQWFRHNKQTIKTLSIEQIQRQYQLGQCGAKMVFDLVQIDANAEVKVFRNAEWILKNENEILRTDKTVEQIAQHLNKTAAQIQYYRSQLKQYLIKKPKTLAQRQQWLFENQQILLSNLKLAEIAQQLNLSVQTVTTRRKQLKELLNIPKQQRPKRPPTQAQKEKEAFMLQHKKLLLSKVLTQQEIAKKLEITEGQVQYLRRKLKNYQLNKV